MITNYTIKKIISFIKTQLENQYHANEILSLTYIILEFLTGYSRSQILLLQDKEVSFEKYQKILGIIKQLKNNKPIQYIIGSTVFYDLPFFVEEGVLIPRQETEELVDWVIQENKNKKLKILDIGTGSGCIAVSVSKNLPFSEVSAIDVSEKALEVSKKNSNQNKTNVTFNQFDILNNKADYPCNFDVIISNPPYVTINEKELMHKNVLDFEPELALFVPNEDPLLFYKAIVHFALKNLNDNGKVYFEINESYGKEVFDLFKEYNFRDIVLKKDIHERDRMISATFIKENF